MTGTRQVAIDRTANSKKAGSVSAHPVFPAIVALWFAALFGIGSLILPPALFDNLAGSMGQGGMGVTGRIAIAVAAAVLGAGLGVLLARRVANVKKPAPVRARSPLNAQEAGADKRAKRPISALEELGPEGLDQPIEASGTAHEETPASGRRRGLAVQDEGSGSEFFDHAPLPGAAGSASDLPSLTDDAEEDVMLELGEFEEDTAPRSDESAGPRDDGESLSAPALARDLDVSFGSGSLSVAPDKDFVTAERPHFMQSQPDDMRSSRPFDGPRVSPTTPENAPDDSAASFTQEIVAEMASQSRPFDAPQSPAPSGETGQESESHLAELRNKVATPPVQQPDQPVAASPSPEPAEGAYAAQPVAKARFGMPQPVADTAEAQPDFAASPDRSSAEEADIRASAPAPASQEEPVSTPQAENRDIASAPLSGLGMVELVERFALSLQRHTDRSPSDLGSQESMTAPSAALSHEMPHEAAGKSAPEAISVPAALQPLDPHFVEDDEDDEHFDDLTLALDRSPAPFAKPQAGVYAREIEVEDEEDDDEDDAGFGSLLAMKSPFGGGREFVRIDDEAAEDEEEDIEPVVVFPGQDTRSASAAHEAPAAPAAAPARATDPAETERALRDALAKLQKMSGAA